MAGIKSFNRNRSGFSLITTLVALAVGTIFLVGITDMFINLYRDQKRINILFQLQQTQKNLNTLISSDSAWEKTVLNNPSLICLNTGTHPDCNIGSTASVTLFTAGGTPYFDPILQGFTLEGEICLKTEPKCKITMTLNAEITCAGTALTCANPASVVVIGLFQPFEISPGNTFSFNSKNYKVNVLKDTVLAAGAGGGLLIQFKCPYKFGGGIDVTPECRGMSTTPMCGPLACPSGFTDAGISAEYTGGNNFLTYGNCIRTCIK